MKIHEDPGHWGGGDNKTTNLRWLVAPGGKTISWLKTIHTGGDTILSATGITPSLQFFAALSRRYTLSGLSPSNISQVHTLDESQVCAKTMMAFHKSRTELGSSRFAFTVRMLVKMTEMTESTSHFWTSGRTRTRCREGSWRIIRVSVTSLALRVKVEGPRARTSSLLGS